MEFSKVRQIHKKLYKFNKENKNVYNKIFIRHWNVFYNQLMNREISIIERTCNTKLFIGLIEEMNGLFGVNFPEIDVSYKDNSKHFKWILSGSSCYNKMNELVQDIKKEEVLCE